MRKIAKRKTKKQKEAELLRNKKKAEKIERQLEEKERKDEADFQAWKDNWIKEDRAKTYAAIQELTINRSEGEHDSCIRVAGPHEITGTSFKASLDENNFLIDGSIDPDDMEALAKFARSVGKGFFYPTYAPTKQDYLYINSFFHRHTKPFLDISIPKFQYPVFVNANVKVKLAKNPTK